VARVFLRVAVTLLTLGLTSYVAGLVAYVAALWVIFRQTAAGDLPAVVYWSGILYAPFVVFILWPLLLSLSARFADARRFVVYPAAGAAAGLIPVVAFGGVWRARTLISPALEGPSCSERCTPQSPTQVPSHIPKLSSTNVKN